MAQVEEGEPLMVNVHPFDERANLVNVVGKDGGVGAGIGEPETPGNVRAKLGISQRLEGGWSPPPKVIRKTGEEPLLPPAATASS